MNLFFDTSALVKYYLSEIGSDSVEKLIIEPTHQIWLSELVKTEFYSALLRRLRTRELTQGDSYLGCPSFLHFPTISRY
ncbi:type II toxin-antitoxin system VapC family toxin [Runella zeae]|uniref:type II toxin-antitoxin system VapC family toxin n=1 Tax=Runella zeae TaxID=94255 RepID=UPI00235617D1|nr:type II toxin-antitoxin system VapC family toxin [Runella zeae]